MGARLGTVEALHGGPVGTVEALHGCSPGHRRAVAWAPSAPSRSKHMLNRALIGVIEHSGFVFHYGTGTSRKLAYRRSTWAFDAT